MKSKSKEKAAGGSATTKTRSRAATTRTETSQSQYPLRPRKPAYKRMEYTILGGEKSIRRTASNRPASDRSLSLDDDKDSLASRRGVEESEEGAPRTSKKKTKDPTARLSSNYRIIDDTCTGCGIIGGHEKKHKTSCVATELVEWFNPDVTIKWVDSAGCAAYRKIHGHNATYIAGCRERKMLAARVKKVPSKSSKGEESDYQSEDEEGEEDDEAE
jgi:hypothetical protein